MKSNIDKKVMAADALGVSYGKYIAEKDGYTAHKVLPKDKKPKAKPRGSVYRQLQGMDIETRAKTLNISEEDATLIMILKAEVVAKEVSFCPSDYLDEVCLKNNNCQYCIACRLNFLKSKKRLSDYE